MTAVENPNYMLAAIRSMAKRPFRVSLGGSEPHRCRNNSHQSLGRRRIHWQVPPSKLLLARRVYARTNPPDDRSMVIFETGHAWEASMTDHFKRQGLLIDNNIKIKQDIAELGRI